MPTTKSFGRKGDKLNPLPSGIHRSWPQLPLLRVFQGVVRFSGGPLKRGDLEGVDDGDIEGCVSSLDPGWEKNVRWVSFAIWEEITELPLGVQGGTLGGGVDGVSETVVARDALSVICAGDSVIAKNVTGLSTCYAVIKS
jgi:hypothetical protein